VRILHLSSSVGTEGRAVSLMGESFAATNGAVTFSTKITGIASS